MRKSNKTNRQLHEYSVNQNLLEKYKEELNSTIFRSREKEVKHLNYLKLNNPNIETYLKPDSDSKLKIENFDHSLFTKHANHLPHKKYLNTKNSMENYTRFLQTKIDRLS